MSEKIANFGTVEWVDLTVADAERIRDFYSQVVGWSHQDVSMGDYNDWSMIAPATDRPAAGICHARGVNVGLPPQWLIYVTVPDLDKSMAKCLSLGGHVIFGPKNLGDKSRLCVIQDPAGAVMALFCPGSE